MNLFKMTQWMFVALLAMVVIFEVQAQAVEPCAYHLQGGQRFTVPAVSNHRNVVVLGNANTWTRLTLPAGVAVSSTGGGRADFWGSGNFAVCPNTSSSANNCGTTLSTGSQTNGTAPDWNPLSLVMNGISATQIQSIQLASPVTGTVVSVNFCKGGN